MGKGKRSGRGRGRMTDGRREGARKDTVSVPGIRSPCERDIARGAGQMGIKTEELPPL